MYFYESDNFNHFITLNKKQIRSFCNRLKIYYSMEHLPKFRESTNDNDYINKYKSKNNPWTVMGWHKFLQRYDPNLLVKDWKTIFAETFYEYLSCK